MAMCRLVLLVAATAAAAAVVMMSGRCVDSSDQERTGIAMHCYCNARHCNSAVLYDSPFCLFPLDAMLRRGDCRL
ncbi:hypothetical protein F5884DRAFT_784094 [Xylogone sp. PMI_703]|nr:hypothetical protein F5884DRAFT_784094 [Xylogone sp. PMI_703]